MYSKVVLLVLFLAIVVLGVMLNKRPTLPSEGYQTNQDAGFCAKKMGGELFDECQRFYSTLGNTSSMFRKLSTDEQVLKIKEYIKADKELRKLEPDTYPYKTPQEQYRAIELHMSGGKLYTSSESSRATARLSSVCPTDAYYEADGKIRIEPSGHSFSSMTEYTNYITAFYARNNCKPIGSVRPYTGPQPGILGGLGSGTASPLQVASERNDRTIVNQALSDLFDKAGETSISNTSGEIPVRTFQFPPPGDETTYAKTPINSLDDYEYNRVFELENRPRMAPLSKQVKSNLLSAMQLDWPILPFSSDTKTKLEEQFVDARMQDVFREPKSGVFFKNMEGADIAPPDEDAAAAREAKILSAYQPTDITTHVVDDEYERVAKVVAQQYSTDPDWEPVVEKRGPHQYAVTELRPRRKTNKAGEEEVVWEGEGTTTIDQAKQQGLLEGGEVKPTSMTIQDNLADPFFAKTGVADHSNDTFWRYDQFSKWTPTLERMFAPTDPTNQWH
jgi:hypothetical protein